MPRRGPVAVSDPKSWTGHPKTWIVVPETPSATPVEVRQLAPQAVELVEVARQPDRLFEALAGFAELAAGGLEPCAPPAVPDGVREHQVVFAATEAPRQEWIITGHEAAAGRIPPRLARIVVPGARSIVDGRAAETEPGFSVEFVAWPPLAELRWRLDGRELGRGGRVRWSPRAGRYRLELLAPDGGVIDRVDFAARGPL